VSDNPRFTGHERSSKYYMYLAIKFTELDHAAIAAAVQQWRHRLTACVTANDEHSELPLYQVGLNN